jgi:hypothetical protein
MVPRDRDSDHQDDFSRIHCRHGCKSAIRCVTIAILRCALDDVLTDPRFLHRRSTSTLEIAEHLLAQAAAGERDLNRLKASAFNRLVSQHSAAVPELTRNAGIKFNEGVSLPCEGVTIERRCDEIPPASLAGRGRDSRAEELNNLRLALVTFACNSMHSKRASKADRSKQRSKPIRS